MLLLLLAIAWLCGLVLADALALPLWPALLLGALTGLAALPLRGRGRLAALLLCAAALGAGRYAAAQLTPGPQHVAQLNRTGELRLVGAVSEDPKRTASGQRVVLRAERILRAGRWQPAEGLVLLTLPTYPERGYGDLLEITAELKLPREAARPNEFDYQRYLARHQIFSIAEPKSARLVEQRSGSPLWATLLRLRDDARHTLLRVMPEPQASLAIGILLGLQASIPADVTADFSATGTSHILVISGWNITIISTALYAIAAALKLDQRRSFWPIIVTIWLYTLFVGATGTVIRAAVMGTIVVVGQRLARPAHAWTTLAAACFAMTLYDPQTLWDLGFQFSALATASLFAFGTATEALLLRTPLRYAWLDWAREALTATLAAQILTLPVILYHFGNLSLIAPLANVALLPMVPAAMLFGALALLGGLLWLPLGQWLALPAYAFLAWLTEGARLFARAPFAAVRLPPFPLWLLIGYYLIVISCYLWSINRGRSTGTAAGVHPGGGPAQAGAAGN